MLESTYKSYRQLADAVKWKEYNCNELFRQYIVHENDQLRDNFLAAIICRYWGYTGRIYTQCNRHVSFEQCYDILLNTINYVLEKRVWENPNSSLYQDQRGPDKAFHVALKRMRSILLSSLNANKRLSNFNPLSIDGFYEEYDDATEGLLFGTDYDNSEGIKTMVSKYFEDGDIIDGLMIDLVCFGVYNTYDAAKIIQMLNALDDKDYSYYKTSYCISKRDYDKALYKIKNTPRKNLTMRLKSLLYMMRSNYE